MEDDENSSFNPKYQNYEVVPLSSFDIIDSEKQSNSYNMKYFIKIFFYIIIAFVFLLLFTYFLQNSSDIESDQYINPKLKIIKKTNLNNNNTKNNININNNINKNINYTNNNSKIKEITTSKIYNRTFSVAFLYSSLYGNGIARFMMVTGEYFVKKGYKVYFLTKPTNYKEFVFNEKIKRIYAFHNYTLIENAIKKEKIEFLIVNNVFDLGMIQKYKSFGVKVIGIFHGVYMSAMFGNNILFYKQWKNTEALDSYIHLTPDDYYYFSHFGFRRNIFIPNLYTFNPDEVPSSNLKSHNIMMLGRLNDEIKGVKYAIKAMKLIVKEVPDAKLNLVSSDSRLKEFKDLSAKLNLTNNVFFLPFAEKISDNFLNSSVFFFPSLSEAFPMALNEAKAYGLPCVTFDVSYSVPFQSGVIKVEMFDHEALAREAIKLLKDYDYRIKKGKEAKLSLYKFNNNETSELWARLFNSLVNGEDEYQKLRKEIENKYYNEKIAQRHMEKQLKYAKIYNKYIRCHSLQNFININYINNIQECKNITRRRRRR